MLARLGGFEPPASGTGIQRSIQLSYKRQRRPIYPMFRRPATTGNAGQLEIKQKEKEIKMVESNRPASVKYDSNTVSENRIM